jgi:hypothetical protein
MSIGPWFHVQSRRTFDRIGRVAPVTHRDRGWLALAALPAVVAIAVYLATNPYPAFGAGLYMTFASEIAANGYAPPSTVAGYTAEGVPFAYPPLQFYVLAVLLDLGAAPVTLARFMPGVAVLLATAPAYFLGRDVTGSRAGGAAAATALSLNPQVLQWHLSAGGVVRAFAFLYALVAISAAYRAFTTDRRRPVVVAAFAFGLTVLSHPTYALFAAGSVLACYVAVSRTLEGLLRGAAIAVGGAVLASPWLAWAMGTFGIDQYAAAAGTHGGVGGGADAIVGYASTLVLVPLAAGAYLLVRRRAFLPLWLAVAELGFQQPRFSYAAGSFAIAAVLVDVADRIDVGERLPTLSRPIGLPWPRGTGPRTWATAIAVVALVSATAVGGGYLAYEMTLVDDPSTPAFLDDESVEAMEWAGAETDPSASFVVLGDAAEWFPLLADRTVVVAPWGVEWRAPSAFHAHLDAFENASRCRTAECVEAATLEVASVPEYVVVPMGHYTIRGHPAVHFGVLSRSFAAAEDWTLAYENDGVVVYRHVEQASVLRPGRRGVRSAGGVQPIPRGGASSAST